MVGETHIADMSHAKEKGRPSAFEEGRGKTTANPMQKGGFELKNNEGIKKDIDRKGKLS